MLQDSSFCRHKAPSGIKKTQTQNTAVAKFSHLTGVLICSEGGLNPKVHIALKCQVISSVNTFPFPGMSWLRVESWYSTGIKKKGLKL